MDLGLHGARALVLGSSSGLGRAVAAALAAEGAAVAVVSRDRQRAEEAREAVGATVALAGDLTTPAMVSASSPRLSRRSEASTSALSTLVAASQVGSGRRRTATMTLRTSRCCARRWRLLGPAPRISPPRARTACVPDGAQRRRGVAGPRLVVGDAQRRRRRGPLTRHRVAPDVLVNVIVTGQFDTPALNRFEAAKAQSDGTTPDHVRAERLAEIPLGRLGRAEELADVVTFLARRGRSFVTGAGDPRRRRRDRVASDGAWSWSSAARRRIRRAGPID